MGGSGGRGGSVCNFGNSAGPCVSACGVMGIYPRASSYVRESGVCDDSEGSVTVSGCVTDDSGG